MAHALCRVQICLSELKEVVEIELPSLDESMHAPAAGKR